MSHAFFYCINSTWGQGRTINFNFYENEYLNEALKEIIVAIRNDDEMEETYPDVITEPMKSMQELQEELDEAVKNEDFDLALKIQEEIKNRNHNIE